MIFSFPQIDAEKVTDFRGFNLGLLLDLKGFPTDLTAVRQVEHRKRRRFSRIKKKIIRTDLAGFRPGRFSKPDRSFSFTSIEN